jgi:hypothetical protein
MSKSIQYVTNEKGERIGVLLDLETYHQLTNPSANDAEILTGLSQDELQALAGSVLSPTAQAKLDELLLRNASNQLTIEENEALDILLAQVDQLNILKTRARYTIKYLEGKSKVA